MKNIYYNPPYDSPIEDEFALTYTKYINENVDFRAQEIVYTKCGQFRIDFIVELEDKRKIGIEYPSVGEHMVNSIRRGN